MQQPSQVFLAVPPGRAKQRHLGGALALALNSDEACLFEARQATIFHCRVNAARANLDVGYREVEQIVVNAAQANPKSRPSSSHSIDMGPLLPTVCLTRHSTMQKGHT